ncbi:hypothetical protein AC578_10557 [Pseudocercospora eumusae]|uniref:Uncharacterized protein n=1 Tax=Pseudocercospora eumusae TaxID=321146 RepID=A0A139H5M2_9PEZI|nr:hypothetical protein AC578_10557 [Pseudocercospora eumusae]
MCGLYLFILAMNDRDLLLSLHQHYSIQNRDRRRKFEFNSCKSRSSAIEMPSTTSQKQHNTSVLPSTTEITDAICSHSSHRGQRMFSALHKLDKLSMALDSAATNEYPRYISSDYRRGVGDTATQSRII